LLGLRLLDLTRVKSVIFPRPLSFGIVHPKLDAV